MKQRFDRSKPYMRNNSIGGDLKTPYEEQLERRVNTAIELLRKIRETEDLVSAVLTIEIDEFLSVHE